MIWWLSVTALHICCYFAFTLIFLFLSSKNFQNAIHLLWPKFDIVLLPSPCSKDTQASLSHNIFLNMCKNSGNFLRHCQVIFLSRSKMRFPSHIILAYTNHKQKKYTSCKYIVIANLIIYFVLYSAVYVLLDFLYFYESFYLFRDEMYPFNYLNWFHNQIKRKFTSPYYYKGYIKQKMIMLFWVVSVSQPDSKFLSEIKI